MTTNTGSTEAVRLQAADWDFLKPGVPFVLGQTNLTLRPLPALMLLSAVGDLEILLATFAGQEDENGNVNEQEIFSAITALLSGPFLGRVSKLIEASSGLHVDDISSLPPEYLISLVDNVVKVNLASREGLKKTLNGLMGTITSLATPKATKA